MYFPQWHSPMTQTVYLDANLLIAHQVRGHIHHERAKQLIDTFWQKQQTGIISSLAIDEFLYGIAFILQSAQKEKASMPFKTYAAPMQHALQAILSWQNIRLVEFTANAEEYTAVIQLIQSENLRPRDAFHLQIMQQQQTSQIATFDHDFDHLSAHLGIHIIPDSPVY